MAGLIPLPATNVAPDPTASATTDASDATQSTSDDAGAPAGDLSASAQMRPRLIPGTDATTGEIPASPQEQADLTQTVNKALLMIHGKKSRNAILQQLHNPTATISQVVGRAAYNILTTISDQKKAVTGQPLDEPTLKEALGYVVPELMTVGCVAGIFPFDAPADDSDLAPGQGDTEYDRQVRLAALEATKLYGEQILHSPQQPQRTEQAQNDFVTAIQKDVQSGKADPRYLQQIKRLQAQGGSLGAGNGGQTGAAAVGNAEAAAEGQS